MPNKRAKTFLFIFAFLIAFALDQISKILIMGLKESDPIRLYRGIPVISGFLEITLTYNYGVIFGFLGNVDSKILLTVNILILSCVIFFIIRELKCGMAGKLYFTAFGMVIGGAVGNIADRIIYGKVIDFIKVYITREFVWPIFNIADSFITVGIILVIIDLIYHLPGVTGNASNTS